MASKEPTTAKDQEPSESAASVAEQPPIPEEETHRDENPFQDETNGTDSKEMEAAFSFQSPHLENTAGYLSHTHDWPVFAWSRKVVLALYS